MPSLAGILYVQSKQMLAFFATPRFGGKRATLGTKTVCSNGLSEGPCTMAFYEVGGQGLLRSPMTQISISAAGEDVPGQASLTQ